MEHILWKLNSIMNEVVINNAIKGTAIVNTTNRKHMNTTTIKPTTANDQNFREEMIADFGFVKELEIKICHFVEYFLCY